MTQLTVDLNALDEVIQSMTAVSGRLQQSRQTIDTQTANLENSKGIEETLKKLNTASKGLEKEIYTLNKRIRELRQVKNLYQKTEDENARLVGRLPEARIFGKGSQTQLTGGKTVTRIEKSADPYRSIRMPKGQENSVTVKMMPETWKQYSHTAPLMPRRQMIHSEWLMKALAVYM